MPHSHGHTLFHAKPYHLQSTPYMKVDLAMEDQCIPYTHTLDRIVAMYIKIKETSSQLEPVRNAM